MLRGLWVYDPTDNLGLMRQARQYQNGGEGIVYQAWVYDQWGRKTQDQTLIPEPHDVNQNLIRLRTFYTLRDDGQPSTVQHPSGTWYHSAYTV